MGQLTAVQTAESWKLGIAGLWGQLGAADSWVQIETAGEGVKLQLETAEWPG